jgi:TonB family protein
MFANVFLCNTDQPSLAAPRPRASKCKVYLAAAALCALGVLPAARAQAPSTPTGTATISEQARKQAESPFKWILINSNAPRPGARTPSADRSAAPSPAPAAAPSPAAARAEPPARVQARAASADPAPTPDSRNPDALAAARAAQAAAAPGSAQVASAQAAPAQVAPTQVALAAAPAARPAEPGLQPAPGPATAPVAAPATQPAPITNPAPAVDVVAPNNPVPPEPVINLVPIRQDEPRISAAVMREHPKGNVRAAFTINTDGSVSDVKIVNSSTRQYNNPVLNAIRSWRFQPIELAQQTEVEMAFNFE